MFCVITSIWGVHRAWVWWWSVVTTIKVCIGLGLGSCCVSQQVIVKLTQMSPAHNDRSSICWKGRHYHLVGPKQKPFSFSLSPCQAPALALLDMNILCHSSPTHLVTYYHVSFNPERHRASFVLTPSASLQSRLFHITLHTSLGHMNAFAVSVA